MKPCLLQYSVLAAMRYGVEGWTTEDKEVVDERREGNRVQTGLREG